jgi:hypothetical protein
MTYTLKQLERAHARVHTLAQDPAPDQLTTEAHAQRIRVMDHIMATMIVFEKRTMDRDELEPNVAILIDSMLRRELNDGSAGEPSQAGVATGAPA